ncbi:MAG TPA: lipopolysaccharide transport periplasmic protein LptA [Rhodocyclaceae bacterium]|nr:lipopolysaccharide transport periplasmic protein LptA [Rhodocyclaceae bacterium]
MTRLLLILIACAGITPAFAEKADRNKPTQLESDRITVDDANKVHILEGRVILTKGTMQLKTEKLVITQDADGFQKSVATGGANGLAYFRQRRDSGEIVEGEAERIEHEDRIERTDLYKRAWLKSGKDEVTGQFIRYDARTENYTVTNNSSGPTPGSDGRVRAVIQPRSNTPEDASSQRSNITLPPPSENKK